MKIFKNFDFFGFVLPLPFQNKTKYNSYCGFFVSVLFLAFMVITLVYFSHDFIYKENPYINEKIKLIDKDKPIEFLNERMFVAFSLWSDSLGNDFRNESIYNISARYAIYNASISEFEEYYDLRIEPCTEKHIPKTPLAQKYFLNSILDTLYCFNPDDYKKLNISGTYNDKFYQSIELFYTRCNNETSGKVKCAPDSVIDDYISTGWISTYMIDLNIDASDYKNPLTKSVKYYGKMFTKNDYAYITFEYMNTDLITDNGFFYNNINSISVKQILNFKTEITNNINKKNIGRVIFLNSKSNKTIKRIYTKIPKILAEIGGIFNILLITFRIIFEPILQLSLYEDIINSNYFVKKIKSNNNCELDESPNKRNILTSSQKNDYEEVISTKKKENSLYNDVYHNLVKIKTNFCELFKIRFFKKNKSEHSKNVEMILKDIQEKIQMDNIIKKFNEIEIIKELIFYQNHIEIINSIPKCIVDPKKQKYEEKDIQKNFSGLLTNIKKKEYKDVIEEKILDNYYKY